MCRAPSQSGGSPTTTTTLGRVCSIGTADGCCCSWSHTSVIHFCYDNQNQRIWCAGRQFQLLLKRRAFTKVKQIIYAKVCRGDSMRRTRRCYGACENAKYLCFGYNFFFAREHSCIWGEPRTHTDEDKELTAGGWQKLLRLGLDLRQRKSFLRFYFSSIFEKFKKAVDISRNEEMTKPPSSNQK